MRTIKFRGKTKDGKWVYGSHHPVKGIAKMKEREVFVNDKGHFDTKLITKEVPIDLVMILERHLPEDIGWSRSDTMVDYNVIPETVGQFTGLLDRNGKEIYEWDVVKHEGWEPSVMQVCFDRGAFYLAYADKHEVADIKYVEDFEIVGNIHDNPELLK